MSFSLDLRVFPDQQPTDVGEEEASSRIMRISIGFGVLVMHPMIAGPVDYGILGRNKVEISFMMKYKTNYYKENC